MTPPRDPIETLEGLWLLQGVLTGCARPGDSNLVLEVRYRGEPPLDAWATTYVSADDPYALARLVPKLTADAREVLVGLVLRDPDTCEPVYGHALWADMSGVRSPRLARQHKRPPTLVLRQRDTTSRLALWALREPLGPRTLHSANRVLARFVETALRHGEPDHVTPPPGAIVPRSSRPATVVDVEMARFRGGDYYAEDVVPISSAAVASQR